MIDPDEACVHCGITRENHGDMQHVFSREGEPLRKKEAPPTPQSLPPTPAGRAAAGDPTTRLVLRLIESLVDKGILDGLDMIKIFGGTDAPASGRTPVQPAEGVVPSSGASGGSGPDPS